MNPMKNIDAATNNVSAFRTFDALVSATIVNGYVPTLIEPTFDCAQLRACYNLRMANLGMWQRAWPSQAEYDSNYKNRRT